MEDNTSPIIRRDEVAELMKKYPNVAQIIISLVF